MHTRLTARSLQHLTYRYLLYVTNMCCTRAGPAGSCTTCVAGKYKEATGDAECSSCPANSNSPAQSTLATHCTCSAGATGQDGDTCTLCVAGKYKAATGNSACTDCAADTYSTVEGAAADSTCTDCPAGSSSPAVRSRSSPPTTGTGVVAVYLQTCRRYDRLCKSAMQKSHHSVTRPY